MQPLTNLRQAFAGAEGTLRLLRELVVLLACLLVFRHGDVLGFQQIGDKYSAGLLNLAVGVAGLYPSGARDEMLVITVDDETLAAAHQAYPPDHAFHARMLEQILRYRPRAIMLDITFETDRGEGTQRLLEVLANRDPSIPIYVAADRSTGEGDRGILPAFAKLVTPVDVQRAIDAARADRYCLVPATTRDHLCWGDEAELDDALPTPRVRHLSAAYQIYLDFCRDHPERTCRRDAPAPEVIEWPLRADRFELLWGYYPPPAVGANDDRTECGIDDRSFWAAARSYGTTLLAFLQDGVDAVRQVCPYTPSVSALAFLAEGRPKLKLRPAGPSVASTSAAKERRAATLSDSVKDRYVFYGFAMQGSPDVIRPPTHVALPGVFLHAMALDNLLTFGDHYKSDVARLGDGWRLSASAINLILFGAVYGIFFVRRVFGPEAFAPFGALPRLLGTWWGGLLFLFLLGAVLTRLLDLAPLNWMGIFGLAAIGQGLAASLLERVTRGFTWSGLALAWAGQRLARLPRPRRPSPAAPDAGKIAPDRGDRP